MTTVTIGNATLILGDCREVLPQIAGIDALVADPPYGIAYSHSGHSGKGFTKARCKVNTPIIGDDAPFDPSHLLTLAPKIILWGYNHFSDRLPSASRVLVWDKVCNPAHYGRWSFSDMELAWSNLPGTLRAIGHLWNGCRRQGEENSFIAQRVHPTQKPVRVMDWCLQLCELADNSLVVDPYMGSATTGIAALRRGHRFMGMELDPAHFETAVARIEAEVVALQSRTQISLI